MPTTTSPVITISYSILSRKHFTMSYSAPTPRNMVINALHSANMYPLHQVTTTSYAQMCLWAHLLTSPPFFQKFWSIRQFYPYKSPRTSQRPSPPHQTMIESIHINIAHSYPSPSLSPILHLQFSTSNPHIQSSISNPPPPILQPISSTSNPPASFT